MYNSESGIPLFRLTVTLLAIFGDGPKVRQGNKVVAPEDNSNSAEHSAANGWADGWRSRDFQK